MRQNTRIRTIYRIQDGTDPADRAHRIVWRELRGSDPPELVEKVSLLLGEIVTERLELRHNTRLTIDVRRSAQANQWCVIDRGAPVLPRGLRSIALDELADAWGITRRGGQTRTWFELHRH